MNYLGHLIDQRNANLWDQIVKSFEISFIKSENGEYSVFSKEKRIEFYIVTENFCKDSFTHEMLHVYLRLKECFVGGHLKNLIACNNELSELMDLALLDHIGNCLDHTKMLPMYLKMGFDRQKFLTDYHTPKCTNEEIIEIKKHYKKGGQLEPTAVRKFIGKIVGILADPNDRFNYDSQLNKLRMIDPVLYRLFIEMFEHWEILDIENFDLGDNYHVMLTNLYDGLESWSNRNNIRFN